MSTFTVGIVYTPSEWRPAFQRHVRVNVAGISLRLVRDSRMAMEEHLDVLVVDNETSFLSPPFVAALRGRGVRILGLYDPDEPDLRGANALQKLGVDRISPSLLAPEDLLAQLQELAPERGLDHRFAEVVAGLDLGDRPDRGEVVAVGGPPGAGATEVAVALSEVIATRRRCLLLDVDEVDPGVARRLQLGPYPHVLAALDELRGAAVPTDVDPAARPLGRVLARSTTGGEHPLGFDVIVGLANRRDWSLLRGDDVASLAEELADSGVASSSISARTSRTFPATSTASVLLVQRCPLPSTSWGCARHLPEADAGTAGALGRQPLLRFLDWLSDVDESARASWRRSCTTMPGRAWRHSPSCRRTPR